MTEMGGIPEMMARICKKVEKKLLKAQNSTKRRYNRKNGGNLQMG